MGESWSHHREARLYPVLTAALSGKDHTALRFTVQHQHALQRFLRECERYLVIGTSGLDDDLLGFLNQCVSSVRLVHYVNYEPSNTEVCRTKFQAGCAAFNDSLMPKRSLGVFAPTSTVKSTNGF